MDGLAVYHEVYYIVRLGRRKGDVGLSLETVLLNAIHRSQQLNPSRYGETPIAPKELITWRT